MRAKYWIHQIWKVFAVLSIGSLIACYGRLPDDVITFIGKTGAVQAVRPKLFMVVVGIFSWGVLNFMALVLASEVGFEAEHLWRKEPFRSWQRTWLSSSELKAIGVARWSILGSLVGILVNLAVIGSAVGLCMMNDPEINVEGHPIKVALFSLTAVLALGYFVFLRPPTAVSRISLTKTN